MTGEKLTAAMTGNRHFEQAGFKALPGEPPSGAMEQRPENRGRAIWRLRFARAPRPSFSPQ
jgi:hypothetical protein